MTVTNVQRLRPAARPLPLRASLAGLAIGLCAAFSASAVPGPAPVESAPLDAPLRPPGAIPN